MAFPEDPLGLRVEIKAGVWTDITADTRTRDAITHTRGIRSGTTAEHATVPLTINNKDGRYSPRNPMSPYFGLIGRNTPVRLSLPGGEHFLDLDGDPANYASTPDHASLDVTNVLDLRWEGEANWHGPGATMLIAKWGELGNRSFNMRVQDGALTLQITRDGTGGPFAGRPLPALPRRAALRAVIDTTTPVGGYTFRHYWAESLAGPWVQIAEDYSVEDSATVVYAGTAPLVIAPSDLSTSPPRIAEGHVYAAEVRSGPGGTVVANPDFTQRPVGNGPFNDAAGRTWSFAGAAAVADRRNLFVGEIASWPQKWVPSGADVWTPVQAAGILRRYGQGVKALDSTLRRRVPSGNPIAYWPMEEDKEATRAYSPIAGVRPAAMTGVEFAGLDTLPSSNPLPKISAGGTLSAIVPPAADGEWQVEFVYNADDKPPASTGTWQELIGVSTTGTVRRWVVGLREGTVRLYGYNQAGADILEISATVGADVFHGWVRLRLWARDTGTGSVAYRLAFQDVGGDAGGFGTTFTGAAGHVTAVTATWSEAMAGWGIGHLSVLPDADSSLYTGSDNGFAGETAWARIRRLAGEESIPVSRIAGPLSPERVGPQRPETLLSLFQEAADADGGMLVESRDRLGLLYRDRSSLYTQEPVLVLDYAAGHIAAGTLEPTDDDDATRNDITVTRTGGSSARAVLAEGPLSVQPPPAGIGLYDESVTLNVEDDQQLEYVAPWRLHLGTYDGARYPAVSVRLHKHPGLIDTVLGLREGDILRLVNLPSWVAYGPVDLLVTGLSETYMPRTWAVTFTCEPGGPWMTAKADHPVYGKADTDGSELAGPVSGTEAALAVRTTAGPQWTSSPRETPFDVQFGGEVARVDTVGKLITGDPWFDTSITGWTPAAGTVAWSQEVVHPKGVGSILVTPGGVAESHSADSPLSPAGSITPGTLYTLCGWFYSPTGAADLRPSIHWFTDAGVFINTSGVSQPAVPAGQWTYLETTATAPATAGRAKIRARQGGTPPASQVFYAWGLRAILADSAAVSDTFSRSVTSGWGVTDSGQTWTRSGGSATDYDVTGTVGRHVHATRDLFRVCYLNSVQLADVDMTTTLTMPVAPTGDGIWTYFLIRTNQAAGTYYFARLYFGLVGQAELEIRKRTPSETMLAAAPVHMTHTAGQTYKVRIQAEGPNLRAKAWKTQDPEPTAWQATAADTDIPGPGGVGVRSYVSPSNTNALPIAVSFDNLRVTDTQTFSVTRSQNGVVKAHAAGTPLSLAHPAIASL